MTTHMKVPIADRLEQLCELLPELHKCQILLVDQLFQISVFAAENVQGEPRKEGQKFLLMRAN